MAPETATDTATGVDARLMEILVCPAPDHGSLRAGHHHSGVLTLTCVSCGRIFPVKDGIPVLVLDEVLTNDVVERESAESRNARV